jgi:hypothetical protein
VTRFGIRIFMLGGAIVMTAIASSAVSPAAPAPPVVPTTLVTVQGQIEAFAQDGARLAWTSASGDSCAKVRIRSVTGGTQSVLADTDGGDGCYLLDAFAIGGDRVVWGGFADCCNHGYGVVTTAARRSRSKTLLSIGQDYHSWGDFLTGASGDGATLVFALTKIDLTKELDPSLGAFHCLPRDPCEWAVTGGGVWRVVGRRKVALPGAPPTVLIAASEGRIALVPADRTVFRGPCTEAANWRGCPEARPAVGGPVEVRAARSGTLLSSFAPSGRVTAIAMDWPLVAVLVRAGGKATIRHYDGRSGASRGRSSVPTTTSNELDLGGGIAVYRVGRKIWQLNVLTGRIRVVTRARGKPIGVSIEDRRVAWGENIRRRGFLRQVVVTTR